MFLLLAYLLTPWLARRTFPLCSAPTYLRTLPDRLQGQEAPVSIVSLTHSDFDDDSAAAAVAGGGAHGMPFVLNANRLNVALSRAQCLAIVVASPQLTQACLT